VTFATASIRTYRCMRLVRRVRCILIVSIVSATVVMGLSTRSGAQGGITDSLSQSDIITFLNQTIAWYQQQSLERQVAVTGSDILFSNDNRPVASQIVRLSFEFAHAAAQQLSSNPTPAQNSGGPNESRYQALAQVVAKIEDQAKSTQTDLDSLRQKLENASARQRKTLESLIAETQSELALLQARRDTLRNIMQFMGGAGGTAGFASQVDALERSVPGVLSDDGSRLNQGNSGQSATMMPAAHSEPSGIWGVLREIFGLSHKLGTIDDAIGRTDKLAQTVKALQAPLRDTLKGLLNQSDAILNQPDSKDPAVLAQQKSTLDRLTTQFKLLSAALVPLSKEAILLDVYKRNLVNWHNVTKGEYSSSLKNLLVRLLGLGVLLGIAFGVFELWRRAIFRYIHDSRRRYQFLLLRRIALWFCVALIVAFGLASELGSVATFAGLLTAGVAVALQNVILAVVGYFLLIGKYGVRVGDRVQVGEVSGEVVEIGLIRLHVLELSGRGADAQPTGRVVAFSNSIVFQPTAGLFKQAPGTSFMWHEISLTLAAESDYRSVEQRILGAVDAGFKDYQKDFERQRRQMEMVLSSVSLGSLEPKVRFRLSPAGLEVIIRFPVELGKGAEIDDRVTREILREIEKEPKLKVVGAEVPTIRLKTEAPPTTTPA
jgi:small-conductance mechanosensitive channel